MEATPVVADRAASDTGPLAELTAELERLDGFAEVQASLTAGHSATLGGVWGSSCALATASLVRQCPATLVVIAPRPAMIDTLADDLALFTSTPVTCFRPSEASPSRTVVIDEIECERLRTIKQLAEQPADLRIVVSSIQALMQPVASRDVLAESTRELKTGQVLDVEELREWLTARGCHGTSAVELPGEFAVRGGIVDLYPPDALAPVRLELFGDEIDSIREFDVATQRSLAKRDSVAVTMLDPNSPGRSHFTSYIPEGSWFVIVEPSDVDEEGRFFHERQESPDLLHSTKTTLAEIYKFPSVTAAGIPAGSYETTCHLGFESVERFSGDLQKVRAELESVAGDERVMLVCETPAEIERLNELFAESALLKEDRLEFVTGRLHEGFRIVPRKTVLLSSAELFHRHASVARTSRSYQGRAIDSFLELKQGDLVVHVAHGIGRYRGIKLLEKEGRAEEHLEIEYDGGTRIYVPSFRIELVQKYVGGKKLRPPLAKIGGKAWVRQKKAAEQAVHDLAAEMIELAAKRDARPGIRFPEDTPWQKEFDAAFPYQETPDQLMAIADIKADMQTTRPMDRLLCGDVGFGKTEMAIRAAFKAVDAGYQVAVLVPTTVLAEQHRRTFAERMSEFPYEIAAVSRFCTAGEQKKIIERTKEGKVDILIGTHRLASGDVQFANLGLLIIDEEQRFGVAIKERLKAMRAVVDVLTMTATPIPRTLHLSLLGVRAISNLETPPADRVAVETRVTRFNDELVRSALLRELNRGGQAYFVHNRVHDIKNVAERLGQIVPEARICIGHGQMPEGQLEDVMVKFVNHEYDILLATTIIESGLDIPNANTMFIDDADRYGLADLHQLRGRVGRYKHRAYCYLLVDENRHLSPEAARRLRAIEEFSQMGAGFALSMRDLEIRGAGNLLGTQQSGHIATVGYEMYCAMLEKAVRQFKNLPPPESIDVNIDLPGAAYLPPQYVADARTKIDLYRRLARLTSIEQVDEFAVELSDRFGPVPEVVESLLERSRLRIWAHGWGIHSLHRDGRYVVLAYGNRAKLRRLVERAGGDLRVADAVSAYFLLSDPDGSPEGMLAEIKSLLRPAAAAA
ncbi:transcription-repair coupling factor [Aeoliella sp.]|uniref:transcription-repair coupling factor n=1 Tax=Aeoliella sp. TaxID=2795800 RepID=UPI003CCBE8EF